MMTSKSPRRLLTALSLTAFLSVLQAQDLKDHQVGPQSNGSVIVPSNQVVTPTGNQVNFNGRPLAVAVSPDQKTAVLLVTGSKGAGSSLLPVAPIVVVDLADGTVKQSFTTTDTNGSYDGLLYSKDGSRLYFSQDDGVITVADVSAKDGTLTLDTQIKLPTHTGTVGIPNDPILPVQSAGANNGGLAFSSDQKTLYVVLNTTNQLGIIEVAGNQLTGEIAVGNAPRGIVVCGNYGYVTNQGGRIAQAGDFTVSSDNTPIVADSESGASTTGTVSVVDLIKQTVVKTINVGLQPTAILAANGDVFVANTNSDTVSVIDTASNRVSQTIHVRPFKDAPFGSSPNALAMTSRGELAVSLGGNNAVALYSYTQSSLLSLKGYIPAGWYPGSLAVAMKQRSAGGVQTPERLLVGNVKGATLGSSLPNTTDTDSPTDQGKATHEEVGSLSIIPTPERVQLAAYSEQVSENNGWARKWEQAYRPLPFQRPGVIDHIFYVIKENRSYDSILGDDPRGDGDASLAIFGGNVSPNHRALADDFVLFDNFYDPSLMSADGHQWADQAIAPDYIEKSVSEFNRSYPFNGGDSLAYAPTGFIWLDALQHGKSVRIYGEYADDFNGPAAQFGAWSDWYNDSLILEGKKTGALHVPPGTFQQTSDVPSVDSHLNRDFPTFNLAIPDQYRMDVFLKDFNGFVANRNLPNLVVMTLSSDHTIGGYPTYPVPVAGVADNDLAVGRLVDAVSHSPYWATSAIMIVEDDSQNAVDHVDGHRAPAYIISPWAQRGQVNHKFYTQLNILRTIEELLGLPPMTQHDTLVPAMVDAFQNSPNLEPYTFIPNQIPLDTLTPVATSGIRKAWQKELAKNFATGPNQQPDRMDNNLLNHAIWYQTKGFATPYPGDKKVLWPNQIQHVAVSGDAEDDKQRTHEISAAHQ